MSGSQCTHKPDKHADGIGDQEAVIQNSEQRVIVVPIWRDDTDETMSFFFLHTIAHKSPTEPVHIDIRSRDQDKRTDPSPSVHAWRLELTVL